MVVLHDVLMKLRYNLDVLVEDLADVVCKKDMTTSVVTMNLRQTWNVIIGFLRLQNSMLIIFCLVLDL